MKAFSMFALLTGLCVSVAAIAQETKTYAERLGWGPKDRVVIFHTDDVGMSRSSNLGAIEALEKGLAKSMSIMMPCPWVPGIVEYLKEHPDTDAGLHLTLTSEWKSYRWGPLVGKPAAPGLVDEQGCLWKNVRDVVAHATPDEVEAEIRAQIERAEKLGMPITHLDSHMGTLFETPEFFLRYVKVGIEKKIPILIAGGHLTYVKKENPDAVAKLGPIVQSIWDSGLPVLDDLHTDSYGWKKEEKIKNYCQLMRDLKPGITEVIMHASRPTEDFPFITDSVNSRDGDLISMTSPELKKAVEEEGIIVTTWRELKERRDKAGK
jgi:predicted glycoside hydrolase/deacetylase ChbG (UPF0249 family)